MGECKTCGEEDCDKHSFFLGKTVKLEQFSGSTPPEIFVGKWNYPNVYTGILAPQVVGDTRVMSSPEEWHKNKLAISDIVGYRNQLIYGRTMSNIKKLETKFLGIMKEVAMTHKSIATEFHLKKPVTENKEQDDRSPLIPKAAEIDRAELQENAPVSPKIDYLVNDTEVKSASAIQELHKANTQTSTIIKILSAGLLGIKKNRKLVPTRWSITAVDDTISKNKIEKIKYFQEISEYRVFHSEYLGNHYEFLLIPNTFSFEVIEISIKNPYKSGIWHDYETEFSRKKYAESVTGAYYANRLAVAEYLESINRQATCIVMREIRPQYYAPCGVGILREASREAFKWKPEVFPTLEEALKAIQSRIKQPISNYTDKSVILKIKKTQSKINQFL
ncbi:MAG: Nre family DNA repair protein [Candidatus Pacearchaeota archaeon]